MIVAPIFLVKVEVSSCVNTIIWIILTGFGELENGDIIEVKTDYGDFYYSVYDSQVVLETETEKLPIQSDEEKLMIYTCYPFDSVGYTNTRHVIYAKKI